MRNSLKDLIGVRKDSYKNLPQELKEFNYYIPDSGHVVMVIPLILYDEAEKSGCLDDYEVGIPCKYVLEKGYKIFNGHVLCEVPYDSTFGAVVDEKYNEY